MMPVWGAGARGAFGEVALWGKVPFGMGLPSLGGDLGVPTALPRPRELLGAPLSFFFFGGGTLPLRRDRGLTAVCLVLVPLRRSASPGTRQDPQEPDQHPQGHPAPRQVSRGGAPLNGGVLPSPVSAGGGHGAGPMRVPPPQVPARASFPRQPAPRRARGLSGAQRCL